MAEEKIVISQLSYNMITRIILAYAKYKGSASLDDIAEDSDIKRRYGTNARRYVTNANTFLIQLGIIEEVKRKSRKQITDGGRNLATAIQLKKT